MASCPPIGENNVIHEGCHSKKIQQLKTFCEHLLRSKFSIVQENAYRRVINRIHNPAPKALLVEEFILLSEHIHLWIFIQ